MWNFGTSALSDLNSIQSLVVTNFNFLVVYDYFRHISYATSASGVTPSTSMLLDAESGGLQRRRVQQRHFPVASV